MANKTDTYFYKSEALRNGIILNIAGERRKTLLNAVKEIMNAYTVSPILQGSTTTLEHSRKNGQCVLFISLCSV